MSKIISKLIKKSPKMSTRFAWVTTILVAIISLLLAISVLNFFTSVIVDINKQTKEEQFEISSKIYESIINTYNTKKFAETKKTINILIENKIIKNVSIVNLKSGTVLFNVNNTEETHNFTPRYIHDGNLISIEFTPRNETLKNYINLFIKKLTYQTLFCIFFGLLMAYILSQLVLRPLTLLTHATEKYKHGDFSEKISMTNYEEIDKLIETYNSMGESLNELYSSLELKVEERTMELEKAYKELKDTQSFLVHSEKMRSLGELVSGITHELNNPINFIYGNLIHLTNYSNDLLSTIDKYKELINSKPEDMVEQANDIYNELDIDFIKDDLPSLIKSCEDGAERAKNIVMNLKSFSRMDTNSIAPVDLAQEIESVLVILNNKIKNRITVHKDYQKDLPAVDAYSSQLSHIFMNILDNASYAIKENGNIYIQISYDENFVTIKIKDDGCGINKEDKQKIFEPFFTTKPVGEGTGLGMSITYKIIKNHNGSINIESEEGKGTTFEIKLPITQKIKESKNE